MPTVPRAGTSYVPTVPRPFVQAGRAFEPTPPVDISPVTNLVGKLLEEERAKADTTALIGADTQLANLHNTLLYDPENGALSKKGFDAGPASKAAAEAFQKGASDISGSLSENQREAFQKIAAQRSVDFDTTLRHHAFTEIDRGKAETTQANLDAERNLTLQAYANPGRVAQGIEHQKNVIALDGASRGQSKEVIEQRTAQEVSAIHTGVINLLLADDKDIDATKYFQAHSGELDARSLLQAKDSLDLGSLRGESQRRADSIAQTSATLGGALSEAQKITDPKLREATEGRIRRHFEDLAADDREQRQRAYQQASAILAQNPDLHAIPPAMMQKLSASEQIELQHLVNQKRNPERPTNWSTYARLLNMAGLNDSTRQAFEQVDLTKYRGELADAQYSHLLTLQLGERRQTTGALSGEAKRQSAIVERNAGQEAKRQAAAEMLRGMGIDVPSPPRAPGAPLRAPSVQLKASPKGKQVPQTWIDRASKDENYKRYLEHMGVVFDTAISSPAARSTGDINLK